MIALEHRVCPHPEVVDTELDGGEMVLLHLESKTYHSLNFTGLRIWQGLKAGLTLQDVSHRLQAEFAVDAEAADRSVVALVAELVHHDLVQTRD